MSSPASPKRRKKTEVRRCRPCLQPQDEKVCFELPDDASLEAEAVKLPTVLLEGGEGTDMPEFRLRNFTFFDGSNHIMEIQSSLSFYGEILHITADSEAVAVHGGPVRSWWLAGLGPGEKVVVGITTDHASYYLQTPSNPYKSVMSRFMQLITIVKIVIEALLVDTDNAGMSVTFESILSVLDSNPQLGLSEEDFIHAADFVIDRVVAFEEAGDDDEQKFMMESPVMRYLTKLSGKETKNRETRKLKRPRESNKSVATALITQIFEDCFELDTQSFLNYDNLDQEVDRLDDSDDDDEISILFESLSRSRSIRKMSVTLHRVDQALFSRENFVSHQYELLGSPFKVLNKKKLYKTAVIDSKQELTVGDFVVYKSTGTICQIMYFLEKEFEYFAHMREYISGKETILKETASEYELFQTFHCFDCALTLIGKQTFVLFSQKNFGKLASRPGPFYRQSYDSYKIRFEDASDVIVAGECPACDHIRKRKKKFKIIVRDQLSQDGSGVSSWEEFQGTDGSVYRLLDAIFLSPENSKRRLNFRVGIISSIEKDEKKPNDVRLKVRHMARPEDVFPDQKSQEKDFHVVYWTDEIFEVDASSVVQKCFLHPDINGLDREKIFDCLDFRLYYKLHYCSETKSFRSLSEEAKNYRPRQDKHHQLFITKRPRNFYNIDCRG